MYAHGCHFSHLMWYIINGINNLSSVNFKWMKNFTIPLSFSCTRVIGVYIDIKYVLQVT